MILEQRIIERFVLALRIKLLSSDLKVEGLLTRDISSKGVFVRTATPWQPGVNVDLTVSLPATEKASAGRSSIAVKGVVVRVDSSGMAIQFKRSCTLVPYKQKVL